MANDKHFRVKNGLKVGDKEVITAEGKLSSSSITLGAILLSDFGTSTATTLSSLSAALGTYESSLTTLTLIEQAQSDANAALTLLLDDKGSASDAAVAAVLARQSACQAKNLAQQFQATADTAKSAALSAASVAQNYKLNASAARVAALSAASAADISKTNAANTLANTILSFSAASVANVSAQAAKAAAENAQSDANAAAVDADAYASEALSDALATFRSFSSALSSKLLASVQAASATSFALQAASAKNTASGAAVTAVEAEGLAVTAKGNSQNAASDAQVAQASASSSLIKVLASEATASTAKVGAVAAEALAIQAKGSAQNSASDAQVAESAASQSQVNALNSEAGASDAKAAAVVAKDLTVNAKGTAQNAASDAQVAEASASQASTDALEAKVSASGAAVSATEAKNTAVNAKGTAQNAASDALVAEASASSALVRTLTSEASASTAKVGAVAAEGLAIQAQGSAENAASDAQVAKASADSFKTLALSAQTAANAAKVGATNAEGLAVAAKGNAQNAASDAQVAQASASSSLVETLASEASASSSKVSATNAASLAINAQGSAESAASDAQVAEASASQASVDALNAKATASGAKVSATNAATLAISARGAASAAKAGAELAESNALQSEATASTAKVSALASQSTALNAKGNAENAASDAQVAEASANQASIDALDAKVSASGAAVSALQAKSSAINAQGSAENAASDAQVAEASANQASIDALAAKATASSASVSAVNAMNLSIQAKGSSQNAASDAQVAQASASSSLVRALASEASASTAKVGAVEAEGLAINAKGSAQNAASDAQVAEASASSSLVKVLQSEASASTAKVGAVVAEGLAIQAQGNAENAASDAQVAKASADSFKTLALSAQTAANAAKVGATNAEGLAVTAKGNAQNAASDAQVAEASASQASTDALNAKATASGAKVSAVQARDLAINAQGSAENAASDAQVAQASASSSLVKTLLSEASASSSKVSALNAESQAINAKGSAQNAASDAQVAEASASQASIDALDAKATASGAKVSAVQARDLAINAKGTAEGAASDAQVAEASASQASTDALDAKATASGAAVTAVQAKSTAVNAKGNALNAASDAQVAEASASQASVNAINSEAGASDAKAAAVIAKDLAVQARGTAQSSASDAQVAEASASQASIDAIDAFASASVAAVGAVQAKSLAINAKGSAENAASDARAAAASASVSNVTAIQAAVTASSAKVSATNAESLAIQAQGNAENAASDALVAKASAVSNNLLAIDAKVSASGAAVSALAHQETALAASNSAQDAADAAILSAQSAETEASSIGALTSQIQDVRAVEARVTNGANGHYVGSDWWLESVSTRNAVQTQIVPLSDGGAIFMDKYTKNHRGLIPKDLATNTSPWTTVYESETFTTRETITISTSSFNIPKEIYLKQNTQQYAVAYFDMWQDGDYTYAGKTLVTKVIFGSEIDGTVAGLYIGDANGVLAYNNRNTVYDKLAGIKPNTEFTFEYEVSNSTQGGNHHRLWLLTDDSITIRYLDIRVKDELDTFSKSTFAVATNASSASTYLVNRRTLSSQYAAFGDFHRVYSTSPFVAYQKNCVAVPRNFSSNYLGAAIRKSHPWRFYIYSPHARTDVDVYAYVGNDNPYIVREGITPPTTTLTIPKGGMVEWSSDYIANPYFPPRDQADMNGQKVKVVFASRGTKILGHLNGNDGVPDQAMPLIPLSNTEVIGAEFVYDSGGNKQNNFEERVAIAVGGGINLTSLQNAVSALADGELGSSNAPLLANVMALNSDFNASGSTTTSDADLVSDYKNGNYISISSYQLIESLIDLLEDYQKQNTIESTFTYDGDTYTLFDADPVDTTVDYTLHRYAKVRDPRFYIGFDAYWDGRGGDMNIGLPRGSLSDLYVFRGESLQNFTVTSVEPCFITVSNKDGELLYNIDHSTASTSAPISTSKGNFQPPLSDLGAGKGPYTFSGTAPFYITAQDNDSVSQTLLGARQGILSGEIQQTAGATQVQSVQSSVDDAVAQVTEAKSSVDGLEAQYSVKINNNGHVSGFGLASSNVSSATSAFVVQADRFAIVAPTGEDLELTPSDADSIPFDITGGITTIKNSFIKELTAENIRGSSITGDNISATTRIQVYNPSDKDATFAALDGLDPIYRLYTGNSNPGAAPFAVTTKGDIVSESLHFRGYRGAYFDSDYGFGIAALTEIDNYIKQGRKGITSATVIGDYDSADETTMTPVEIFSNKFSASSSNVYQKYRIPANKLSVNKSESYYSQQVAPWKVNLGTLAPGDSNMTIVENGQSGTVFVQRPVEGEASDGTIQYTYSNSAVKNRNYKIGELLLLEWSGNIGAAYITANGFVEAGGAAVNALQIGAGTAYPTSILLKVTGDCGLFTITRDGGNSGVITYTPKNNGQGSGKADTVVGTMQAKARAEIPSIIKMQPNRKMPADNSTETFMANNNPDSSWDSNGKLVFTAIETDDTFDSDPAVSQLQYRVITGPELIDATSIQASAHVDWRVGINTGGVVDGFLTGYTVDAQITNDDVDNSLPPGTYKYGVVIEYLSADENDVLDTLPHIHSIERVIETEILGFYDEFYVEPDRKIIIENDVCQKLVTTIANSYVTDVQGGAYGIEFRGNSFWMVENDFRDAGPVDLGMQAMFLGNAGGITVNESEHLFVIGTRPDPSSDYTKKLHLTELGVLYIGPAGDKRVVHEEEMSTYVTSKVAGVAYEDDLKLTNSSGTVIDFELTYDRTYKRAQIKQGPEARDMRLVDKNNSARFVIQTENVRHNHGIYSWMSKSLRVGSGGTTWIHSSTICSSNLLASTIKAHSNLHAGTRIYTPRIRFGNETIDQTQAYKTNITGVTSLSGEDAGGSGGYNITNNIYQNSSNRSRLYTVIIDGGNDIWGAAIHSASQTSLITNKTAKRSAQGGSTTGQGASTCVWFYVGVSDSSHPDAATATFIVPPSHYWVLKSSIEDTDRNNDLDVMSVKWIEI